MDERTTSSGSAVRVLLEQAEALARGGDFDGAAARAREARRCARARVDVEEADLALDRILASARRWQTENESRHRGYVAREHAAIAGAEASEARIEEEEHRRGAPVAVLQRRAASARGAIQ